MRQRSADAKTVHHTFQGSDLGSAVTSLALSMDGLITGTEAATCNPGFPRAAKLVGVFTHATCAAVNSAGDWTLRIKDGSSGTDLATFNMPMAAIPGSKTFGQATSQIIVQAGTTYYVSADGPSRLVVVARVVLEWELL